MTERRAIVSSAFALRQAGVYYALALVLAGMAAITAAYGMPAYLTFANLGNIAYQASLVGIVGVGMTVLLIAGAFDLSVASVAALAAAVMVGLAGQIGVVPAMLAALCAAAAVGVFNALVVELAGINAFIVTLATLTAVRGLVLVMTGGRSLMVEQPAVLAHMLALESGRVRIDLPLAVVAIVLIALGAAQKRAGRPVLLTGIALLVIAGAAVGATVAMPVACLAVLATIAWAVMTQTVVGRRLQAVGSNAEAARLSGIAVERYRIGAFVLVSLTAGLAGVLFACRLGSVNPTALTGMELTVIAAAILGGTSLYGGSGSVVRTLAGAFLLFALTNGFNVLDIGANYQGIIEGAVIIVAAAIYSTGNRRSARHGGAG